MPPSPFLNFRNLKTYLRESRKSVRAFPGQCTYPGLARHYSEWQRTMAADFTPLGGGIPWISIPAIDFLRAALRPEMRVHEYGSGGSTRFFSKRVQQVVSVEHDPVWVKKVTSAIASEGLSNCDLLLITPVQLEPGSANDPANPDHYATDDETFRQFSFERYVRNIDRFPDEWFDVILIDGRSRPSCFKHALKKIRPGGAIVWDNSERPYYHASMALAPAHWTVQHFPGPCPCLRAFTRTSVWRRPTDTSR